MKPRHAAVLLLCLLVLSVAGAVGSDQKPAPQKPSPPPRMTSHTRMEMIRAFESELVYIRTQFPMGKKGLTLKNGVLSPSGVDLQRLIVTWGPSVKPGDQARITSIAIKDDRIHFEINGGPVKKKKWYQRIEIDGASGSATVPSDANANPRGSYVELVFDHYIPEMDAPQLKHLLRPVFDFDAKSAVEAYLETIPPKVKEAIKNHQVLVGMNREMVIYSKGRAPKKIREKEGEAEYEDWIYGEPPQDVDFVRFVGDEVTRVETMKVTGEKVVRVEKEVDLNPQPSVAAASPASPPAESHAPTLRRPGEDLPTPPPATTSTRPIAPAPTGPPPSDPGAKPPDFAPSELAQADLPR